MQRCACTALMCCTLCVSPCVPALPPAPPLTLDEGREGGDGHEGEKGHHEEEQGSTAVHVLPRIVQLWGRGYGRKNKCGERLQQSTSTAAALARDVEPSQSRPGCLES